MKPKKKPSLAVLLGVGPKEPAEEETDESMGGKGEAATQILEAVKASDATALEAALSAFVDLHMSEEDEEEGDEEADEGEEEVGAV